MKPVRSLEDHLAAAHPKLRAQLLELFESIGSDIERADDVEEALIARIPEFGRRLMQDWATKRERTVSQKFAETTPGQTAKEKNTSTGTRSMARSPSRNKPS